MGDAVPGEERPLRRRILDAATEITATSGWGAVTMASVAQRAGVSRQSVYNEVGAKPDLARALVIRESARFLQAVEAELALGGTIRGDFERASARVFELGVANPLLQAAVSTAQGTRHDLLPLLTTQSEGLIESATGLISASVRQHHPQVQLADPDLAAAATAIVRLVLSFLTRPSGTPGEMAAEIGWISSRLLAPATDAPAG